MPPRPRSPAAASPPPTCPPPVDDPDAGTAGGGDIGADPDELAHLVALDAEAQCLNALLWAPTDLATRVVAHLDAGDFHRPAYARLYTVVAGLVRAGRPHTAPLVLTELHRGGAVPDALRRALLEVTLGDARGHDAGHYARAVLAQAYRRGYTDAAIRLAQHAREPSESDLYEQMCILGRRQRAARDRLDTATTALT